jgi:hypothetical protein
MCVPVSAFTSRPGALGCATVHSWGGRLLPGSAEAREVGRSLAASYLVEELRE